jgi:lysophospholipase L1-like esterase
MLTRRHIMFQSAAALLATPVLGETWDEQWARMLKEDWPGWKKYAAMNDAHKAKNGPVDIVFMGDSITEGWCEKRPAFFSAQRVCRGISGQTTPQMVLRMLPDVCDLKPRYVHILAGTNDIAGNTGPMTLQDSQNCFIAMCDIAQMHNIGVIIGSILPAASFPWRPEVETLKPITALNAWLADFTSQRRITFVDYHRMMADPSGGMKPDLAYDGVHPTAAGYDVMSQILEPILATKMKLPRKPLVKKD